MFVVKFIIATMTGVAPSAMWLIYDYEGKFEGGEIPPYCLTPRNVIYDCTKSEGKDGEKEEKKLYH